MACFSLFYLYFLLLYLVPVRPLCTAVIYPRLFSLYCHYFHCFLMLSATCFRSSFLPFLPFLFLFSFCLFPVQHQASPSHTLGHSAIKRLLGGVLYCLRRSVQFHVLIYLFPFPAPLLILCHKCFASCTVILRVIGYIYSPLQPNVPRCACVRVRARVSVNIRFLLQ